MTGSAIDRLRSVLLDVPRTTKPRVGGVTMMLDKGLGPAEVESLTDVAADHIDYAKIAWGSSLITRDLERKLELYRARDVIPTLGGSLFEYAHLRGQVEPLLDFVKEAKLSIELSDSICHISRRDKLAWIERFAAHGRVLSEVGRKTEQVDQPWTQRIADEIEAGAEKIVIEGREIGPASGEFRSDLVEQMVSEFPAEKLIFEALERKQQVSLIKQLGPDVNLGNILPHDVLTVESFRRGLKEHTLLHMHDRVSRSAL